MSTKAVTADMDRVARAVDLFDNIDEALRTIRGSLSELGLIVRNLAGIPETERVGR